ncbi:hypothetical protein LCGC14_1923900 [marine sediment metagenome]|uniref:C_GCAxxG_C_C family protein n=1 Tax=marine sediment metagenome TaxID=412755 RepID=A0A0F9FPS6_9ZZZZ
MKEKNNRIKEIVDKARKIAEGYFSRGEFFCSESVVHTINQLMGSPLPHQITKLASGFPIGLGKSGCLCGAISGGVIALGIAYGRNHGETMNPKMFPLSAKLHDFIKEQYGSTCCRVLIKDYDFESPERKKHCIKITGEVAAFVTEVFLKDASYTEVITNSDVFS